MGADGSKDFFSVGLVKFTEEGDDFCGGLIRHFLMTLAKESFGRFSSHHRIDSPLEKIIMNLE